MLATKVEEAKREEGFTLIELLVVVIIIGILAAIAIPVFLNQRERAWIRAAQSDLRNAAIEVESYFNDDFSYPVNQAAFDNLGDINPSPNVVLVGTTTQGATYLRNDAGDAFCLAVSHLNIDSSGAQIVATYVSDAGGIQETPAACSSYTGFS